MKKLILALSLLISSFTFSQTKWFTVPVDVYETNVRVIITKDSVEARNMSIFFTQDTSITYSDFDYRLYDGRMFNSASEMVIWFPDLPKTIEDFGTIAHEVFHAAHYILEYREIQLSYETTEVYAYLIDYLTKSIYLKLNDYYGISK